MDDNAGLIAERTSLLSTIEALEEADWDHETLCEGWRVRDVVIHVAQAVTISKPALIAGLVRKRGDINAFFAEYVPKEGNRPVEDLLAEYRSMAASAKGPPRFKKVQLAVDALTHHHDIALPLGRAVPTEASRLPWLLDGMVNAEMPVYARSRCAGLRLSATDVDWTHGSGPAVTGPAAALLLAGCGRRALDAQLTGDGVEVIQSR